MNKKLIALSIAVPTIAATALLVENDRKSKKLSKANDLLKIQGEALDISKDLLAVFAEQRGTIKIPTALYDRMEFFTMMQKNQMM